MGCGCRGGSGNKGGSGSGSGGDLTKFAFLTPRQLKIRDQQLAAKKAAEEKKKNPNG
jgi:hypothetical protein